MSPCPSSCSAPIWSRMVLESTREETWNAIRAGILALIRPVMTSTEGRWVASDQVDTGRPRLLRQACDQFLDLLADDHHHVGELVDHHDDVREWLEVRRLPSGTSGRAGCQNRVLQRFTLVRGIAHLAVETGEVAHAQR